MMLSLCMAFYTNSAMLTEQYRVWAAYPEVVKRALEIVLVDDGSPDAALAVPRPDGLPPLRIYRVLEDQPWHQHGARNLAAYKAAGEWLLLTDMDHVVPARSMAALIERLSVAMPREVFTFFRVDAPTFTPKRDERGRLHPHPNTFAVRRTHFWAVGGYDEDCVGYGTDAFLRRRLDAVSRVVHLDDVPVVRYSRDVIPDASTRADRNAGRQTARNLQMLAEKRERQQGPTVMAFPWERVL